MDPKKKLLELHDKRNGFLDKVDEIRKAAKDDKGEKRSLTTEEQEQISGLLDEAEALEQPIKNAELQVRENDAKERRLFTPGPRQEPVESRKDYHSWPVDEAWQWVAAVRGIQSGGGLPKGVHSDYEDSIRAITGHGTLVEQDGGWAVPETINAQILQKMHQEGQILSRCQPVPITVGNSTKWNAVTENSRASGSRYGGITVSRVGEGGSISASTVQAEKVTLEVKKQAAAVYVTEELLDDGPQLMTLISSLVPKAIVFDTEDEIFNGLGTTGCKGILNEDALVSVSKESGQAAATILFENIVKMWARMYAPSRSNAVWFINQDIEPQLFTMSLAVGTGGVPVYLPAGGASGSPFGSLMGRPVIPVEHAATLGTVGDIVLADMSQYLYATKGGLKSASSMHVRFLQDEQVFKFTQRNDGRSWWPAVLTPNKGSNTLSPFVALATRA